MRKIDLTNVLIKSDRTSDSFKKAIDFFIKNDKTLPTNYDLFIYYRSHNYVGFNRENIITAYSGGSWLEGKQIILVENLENFKIKMPKWKKHWRGN